MTDPITMPASLEGLHAALKTLRQRLPAEDGLQPVIDQALADWQTFASEVNRADEHSRLAAM